MLIIANFFLFLVPWPHENWKANAWLKDEEKTMAVKEWTIFLKMKQNKIEEETFSL